MLKGCSAMKIATWNINSIRLREQLVTRLLTEEQPDILCLQEATDVFKFNDLTSWNTQKYCSKILVFMVHCSKIAQNWRRYFGETNRQGRDAFRQGWAAKGLSAQWPGKWSTNLQADKPKNDNVQRIKLDFEMGYANSNHALQLTRRIHEMKPSWDLCNRPSTRWRSTERRVG